MSSRTVRHLLTTAAAAALVAGSAACSGDGASTAIGPYAPVIGTVGGSAGGANAAAASALVGQWLRLVYGTDSTGVRTSETTWEFRADSTATRSVVARQLSTGFFSTVSTPGEWSVSGTTLTITLFPNGGGRATGAGGLPPVTGNPNFNTTPDTTRATTLNFAFRIDSTTATRTLYLDQVPYVYAGPPATP